VIPYRESIDALNTLKGLFFIRKHYSIFNADMQREKPAKIIAMTIIRDKAQLKELLRAKQYAFVMEDATPGELKKALKSIQENQQYISDRLAKYSLFNLAIPETDDSISSKLTCRENEIANLIAHGMTSRKIALQLHISMDTVDTHRRNILKKLGLKNSAALVKYTLTRTHH
jgi:DNA-binding NarL/FixJ family response regulator